MQGLWVDRERPKFKKDVVVAVADRPDHVWIERTSLFGDEYEGSVADAPAGTYNVVGPNPYTDRKWYATIVVASDGTVKVR